MERRKKILLRIIFLMGVLLCSGISVYSNSAIQLINTERSSDTKKEVNSPVTEVDFYDDEQINPIYDYCAVVNTTLQKTVSRHRISIFSYSASLWQPPKNKENIF